MIRSMCLIHRMVLRMLWRFRLRRFCLENGHRRKWFRMTCLVIDRFEGAVMAIRVISVRLLHLSRSGDRFRRFT